MCTSSVALTERLSAGSSRNHGTNARHHTIPIAPEMKNAIRQGSSDAIQLAAPVAETLVCEAAIPRVMVPKIIGANAAPNLAASQIAPPARARSLIGSQRD